MKRWIWVLPATITAATCVALAQGPSEPLIKQTFKDSDGGWTGFGMTAKVSVTHETPLVESGGGALKFDYAIAKGEFNALLLPTSLGSLAKANSIKFRVRTDGTTMLAVVLQKQGGGRFVATFQVPKNTWQQVELSTSDFALSQDKDDPKDPDGKLEMDQVSSIAIGDVAQLFAQTDNQALLSLVDIKTGGHALYVEDFTVGADPVPAGSTSSASEVRIDTFAHPQLGWFVLGPGHASRFSGKPLEGVGMKVDYHQAPGKIMGLTRSVAPGSLSGMKNVSFDVASALPTQLVVQVEELNGIKFNATVDVAGGSELKPTSVAFSDFKAADDSSDPAAKFDASKIKTLTIIDLSGAQYQTDHENTLWIGKVVASTR